MELFVDIETLPGPERPSPEDIEPPKNYKDPAKIRAYQQERVEEVYRAQALDSMKGRILCIGWAFDDEPAKSLIIGLDGIDSEKELLSEFQVEFFENLGSVAWSHTQPTWVGHNIHRFDLPWLWRKSLQNRAIQLAHLIPRGRYSNQVIDTAWLWAADYKDHVSLDAVAQYLGIGCKTDGVDGSKVFDLWQAGELQTIRSYCEQDVELARKVARFILTGEGAFEHATY